VIVSVFISLLIMDLLMVASFGVSSAFLEITFMILISFQLRKRLQTVLDLPVFLFL